MSSPKKESRERWFIGFIVIVLLLIVMGSCARGDEAGANVLRPPEDGAKWATVICTSDHWQSNPREAALVAWFYGQHAKLTSLRESTHFFHLTTSHWAYRHRYRRAVNDLLPAVIVQRYDGKASYVAKGDAVPQSAEQLVAELETYICKRPPCPGPNCPVRPVPVPVRPVPVRPVPVPVPVQPQPTPDGQPDAAPAPEQQPFFVLPDSRDSVRDRMGLGEIDPGTFLTVGFVVVCLVIVVVLVVVMKGGDR